MYGYESWTIKKAECWRIDAFELWCWRRLLRVPWTARRNKKSFSVHPKGNQSWIFIGRTDAEAEAPKLWPSDGKNWLTRKDPVLGTIKGGRRRRRQRMRWLDGITDSRSWWWTERPGMLRFMRSQRVGHDWATELNRKCGTSGSETKCFTTNDTAKSRGIILILVLLTPKSHLISQSQIQPWEKAK